MPMPRPSRPPWVRLFEEAPRFLAKLAAARPFGSWESLFVRADELALAMPMDAQLELIDAHPRIGASPGSVSALSFREQGYDQEQPSSWQTPRPPKRERAAPDAGSAQRRLRGPFRLSLRHLRGRSTAIGYRSAAWNARLDAQADDERRRALHDVVAIARDRATRLAPSGTARRTRPTR